MAHKESSEIAPGSGYSLGAYTFTMQNVVSEGERVIQAHVTGPDGSAAHGITVPTNTQVLGWYVEANEDTADVYAVVKKQALIDMAPPVILESVEEGDVYLGNVKDTAYYYFSELSGDAQVSMIQFPYFNQYWKALVSLGSFSGQSRRHAPTGWNPQIEDFVSSRVTIGSLSGYVGFAKEGPAKWNVGVSAQQPDTHTYNQWAVAALYGGGDEEQEILVGRFAIDLEDAGGTGEDSDWDDPDDEYPDDPIYPEDPDYPDPEDPDYPDPIYPDDPDYPYGPDDPEYPDPYQPPYEPPTHTLYLNVAGATSGRHNDPLNDTSFSYLPQDNLTQKFYGCGGDGGHGGGGGGGASTVVVYKFATSQANSKEITVSAKRHGYGSGGGKGGKGGDGCILIYY